MAIFIASHLRNPARHHVELDATEGEKVASRTNHIKKALLASYPPLPTEDVERTDYFVCFHGYFPEEVSFSFRVYGDMAFTESIRVTVPPCGGSMHEVLLEGRSTLSFSLILRRARCVGSRVVAVGISEGPTECEPVFLRSVSVRELKSGSEEELLVARLPAPPPSVESQPPRSPAGERPRITVGLSTADLVGEYRASLDESPLDESPPEDAVPLSDEEAEEELAEEAPVEAGEGLAAPREVRRGRSLSVSGFTLDDFTMPKADEVSCFHAPVFRRLGAEFEFDGVFYAHPMVKGHRITSSTLTVHAKVTKRKKSELLFQIQARSGKYSWHLWLSKDQLLSFDGVLRIRHPKTVVRPFPVDPEFEVPQRSLAKLNIWLTDVLECTATALSSVTYAMLNVPPRFFRADSAEADDVVSDIDQIYTLMLRDREPVEAAEVKKVCEKLFSPLVSESKLKLFLPEKIEANSTSMLSREEVKEVMEEVLDRWLEDVSGSEMKVTHAALQEQLLRLYGWSARLKKKRFLHKHFDDCLRLIDREGDGALDKEELRSLLLHVARRGDPSSPESFDVSSVGSLSSPSFLT